LHQKHDVELVLLDEMFVFDLIMGRIIFGSSAEFVDA